MCSAEDNGEKVLSLEPHTHGFLSPSNENCSFYFQYPLTPYVRGALAPFQKCRPSLVPFPVHQAPVHRCLKALHLIHLGGRSRNPIILQCDLTFKQAELPRRSKHEASRAVSSREGHILCPLHSPMSLSCLFFLLLNQYAHPLVCRSVGQDIFKTSSHLEYIESGRRTVMGDVTQSAECCLACLKPRI